MSFIDKFALRVAKALIPLVVEAIADEIEQRLDAKVESVRVEIRAEAESLLGRIKAAATGIPVIGPIFRDLSL